MLDCSTFSIHKRNNYLYRQPRLVNEMIWGGKIKQQVNKRWRMWIRNWSAIRETNYKLLSERGPTQIRKSNEAALLTLSFYSFHLLLIKYYLSDFNCITTMKNCTIFCISLVNNKSIVLLQSNVIFILCHLHPKTLVRSIQKLTFLGKPIPHINKINLPFQI